MTILLVIFAIVLCVLPLIVERQGEVDVSGCTERNDSEQRARSEAAPPFALLPRIFSGEDRKFILALRSERLERLFRAERRKVALQWVWQTSRETQEVMRVHRLASRWRHDLNAATEAKLTFDYLLLRLVCGLLSLLIGIFGPQSFAQLAGYAGRLCERIDGALANTGYVRRLPAPIP